MKSLVGVDVKAKDALPQDIQIDGFDNIAAALNVSPAFLVQYITSARTIAKLAMGSPKVTNVKYLINANNNPDDPLPLGTRGGIRFKHNFPADGLYRINIDDELSAGLYTSTMENESTLVMMIDGKIVFKQPIGGRADQQLADRQGADGRAKIMERFSKIPVQVKAGIRDVVVAFIERSAVESDENVAAGFGGQSGGFGAGNGRMARLVGGVDVVGPYESTGISKTPSRDLIFVCDPKAKGEPACAKQITETLARRAFRRPVTADDVTPLMAFYDDARKSGGTFDQGVEQVVAAVLASPDFLYRAILGPKGSKPDAEVPLTDIELASRLSFFLWNTGPDDELLNLASTNRLSKPGVMEAQVKRMMADAKASSLVSSFSTKWLGLDGLDGVKPDPTLFREFNEQLRKDFLTEAQSFISRVLLDDHSVMDLLTDNHTFVNDRLARHYGIQGVQGAQFRPVVLTDQKERLGPARQSGHRDAHILWRPHVAGAARRLGAG